MEPITTSIAIATSAFNLVSKGVAAGRDLNSVLGNLGKYMGAVNDIEYKSKKKPRLFQKIFTGSSIEEEAMEAFAAKKKAEGARPVVKPAAKRSANVAKGKSKERARDAMNRSGSIDDVAKYLTT